MMTLHKQAMNQFEIKSKDSLIYVDNKRNVLVSMSAFGELRKDLINNIGLERMKGFLIRYGWDLGRQDGKKIKSKKVKDIKEKIEYGPLLHTKKGHVIAETTSLEIDETKEFPFIKMEGIWKSSYEAHEHKRLFGEAEQAVCYTLIGYASGYISELFDRTVIFKELSCEGKGDLYCHWVGKPIESWGDEIEDIMIHYSASPIVQELEETYEKLLEERNNLARAADIHKRLTEEIIRGNDLQSISNVVHETFGIPLLIEDFQFRTLAQSTFLESKLQTIKSSFHSYLDDKQYLTHIKMDSSFRPFPRTKFIHLSDHQRLITPILLQDHIYGYCSFIYLGSHQNYPEIANMIIERISSVCSLYLLNEKAKFETSERIKGNFLQELINGQFISKKDVIKRANYMNLNLERPFYIAVIKYDAPYDDTKKEIAFHERLMEQIRVYFKNNELNILIGQRSNYIILLVSIEDLINDSIEHFVMDTLNFLRKKNPHVLFGGGISVQSHEIKQIPYLFEQALAAVRLTISKRKVVTFQSLGIVGSLINTQNKEVAKKSAQDTLEPICSMCDVRRGEFLKTLYYFLENGGNLEETAADLALSVSGLRYRIRKIEEILERDLRDPVENYQLLLSLQVLILIDELEVY